MHPDVPETPQFWDQLEARLVAAAAPIVPLADTPETPHFDSRLDDELVSAAAQFAEPRFPKTAAAAIAAIVLLTATVLNVLPGRQTDSVAAPGVVRSTEIALDDAIEIAGSAEAMVVASFQRFMDPRNSADRLASDLRNRGYEVSVSHLTVADPALDGAVLSIRHAFDASGATLGPGSARGPVILIVAHAPADRPMS